MKLRLNVNGVLSGTKPEISDHGQSLVKVGERLEKKQMGEKEIKYTEMNDWAIGNKLWNKITW